MSSPGRGHHRAGLALTALSGLLLVAFTARAALGIGDEAVRELFSIYVYIACMLLAGAACVLRGLARTPDRRGWQIMGVAAMSWSAGNIVYGYLEARNPGMVPVPSIADAFWLGSPLLLTAALFALGRAMGPFRRRRGAWLDGALCAATIAAVSGAVVIEPIVAAAGEQDLKGFLTNLAYPVSDIAMVSMAVWIVAMRGWRVTRAYVLLAVAVVIQGVGDSVYLAQVAAGTYRGGGLVDLGWLLPGFTIAVASLLAPKAAEQEETGARLERLVPVFVGAVALALLVAEALGDPSVLSVAMAGVALALTLVRMGVALADNRVMLAESRVEALTDPVTGLANRRSLFNDVGEVLEQGGHATLTMFDLDGFKSYNDTFGHGAGDDLLCRIGADLDAAVGGHGRAYRMGGDEFATLVSPGGPTPEALAEAMVQTGNGFRVGASFGTAAVPDEGATPEQLLLIADQRMYARKVSGRTSAGRQSADVLLAVLEERNPGLAVHGQAVAELALATALELGLDEAEAEGVRHAALLHDIGKLSLPEAILDKPSALDEEEWRFVRRHPLIGERIMRAAPSLSTAAGLVRACQERVDGGGYPKGLAGEDIPLGARIILVADAFHSMISERPYRRPRSEADALAELRAHTGTQFDAAVVAAFAAARAAAAETPRTGVAATAIAA